MILSNQVRCDRCGDTPFSANRHDFKSCNCGAISVDGGMEYLRRVGDGPFTDLSIMVPDKAVDAAMTAVTWANDTGRNQLGMVCAVVRALRDNGVKFSVAA